MLTAKVVSGYRRLFRARAKLFVGDQRAMMESRKAIRAEFDKNRFVKDPATMEGLLTMIDEAEDMLVHGIVRGELNQSSGNYEVKIKPEHAERMDSETMTHIDPITAETGESNGKPEITVTKSSKK